MEPSFDPTVFTKNRARLITHQMGRQLFDEVLAQAHEQGLLSDEHFTVDGTIIEAAASMKGAFNQVSLKLQHDASEEDVIAALDLLLANYGGTGAYDLQELTAIELGHGWAPQ